MIAMVDDSRNTNFFNQIHLPKYVILIIILFNVFKQSLKRIK